MKLFPDFQPWPLVSGGHLQTLGGHFARSRLRWTHPSENVAVDTADGARLLVRASWQPGARRASPALLLVHGLEGSDTSGYVLSAGSLAYRRGWHVARMNMRGCGASLALCPLLYNAGLTSDLLAVLDWLSSQVDRIAVVGFSLGANLLILTLAREQAAVASSLHAAVAVCPPLDLDECARAIDHPSNHFYRAYFLRRLKASYHARQLRSPDRYPAGLERECSTIRGYDEAITAPFGGYEGAEDYYARASSGPELRRVRVPLLVLSSRDDPFIPAGSVSRWLYGPLVQHELTSSGGHVGFLGRTSAPGFFWAAERALGFADQQVLS